MMRVLDLFSGIGGFSLGMERSGGFQTVAFCELSPFCRRVLAMHWPDVRQYTDVESLTGDAIRADGLDVDCIIGGFPCQDISLAGTGAGLAGSRSGLWWHYARLIGELRPRYVVIENVSALRARGLDTVLGTLVALGYDAEWHCIPASAVGAPHRRDRVWIVAYPTASGRQAGTYFPGDATGTSGLLQFAGLDRGYARQGRAPEPSNAVLDDSERDGQPPRGHHHRQHDGQLAGAAGAHARPMADAEHGRCEGRIKADGRGAGPALPCGEAVANAHEARLAQPTWRERELWLGSVFGGQAVANADGAMRQGGERDGRQAVGQVRPGPSDGRADLSQPRSSRLEIGQGTIREWAHAATSGDGWWAAEPNVGRVAHGVPHRVDRLEALGNALVPDIAELIAHHILRAEACYAA